MDKGVEEFLKKYVKKDFVIEKIDEKITYWTTWRDTHAFDKTGVSIIIRGLEELKTSLLGEEKSGYKIGDIIFFEPNHWTYHGGIGGQDLNGVPSNKGYKILKISKDSVMLGDPDDDMRPITVNIKMFDENIVREVLRDR